MNEIKVSVIIPVYNSKEYLDKCIESVVNQTLHDIEIICVNDGSIDSSPEIIKKYADRDDRIKVIHQKNSGPSIAKNKAMDIASGEYIIFLDSDDWLSLDAVEKAYLEIEEKCADFSFYATESIDNLTGYPSDYMAEHLKLKGFSENFDDEKFSCLDTIDNFFYIPVTVCSKIYRRSFLQNINAKFAEGLVYEDNQFFYYIYKHAKKVSLTREVLYYYRVNNPKSITKNIRKNFLNYIKSLDESSTILETYPIYDEIADKFAQFKITKLMAIFENLNLVEKIKYYGLFHKKFIEMPLSYDAELMMMRNGFIYYQKFNIIRNKNVLAWLVLYLQACIKLQKKINFDKKQQGDS